MSGHRASVDRRSLRLAATLLIVGQLAYIGVTLLHAGGEANDHAAIFAAYASSGNWTAVHLGQFVAMTVLLGGLVVLFLDLDPGSGGRRWLGGVGAGAAAGTWALYGVLQAVDGVALRQAVVAWTNAPEPERAARFAVAEVVRWLEWGTRSYHESALGLTLLLAAAALARTVGLPRPIAYLAGLSGLAALLQGWVVGSEGFSRTETTAIVLGFVLNLAWMTWLVVRAWRMRDPSVSSHEG